MQQISKIILMIFLGLSFVHTAFAMPRVNPFQVSIHATGQLDADQQNAFTLLIRRLTGREDALATPAFTKALHHADDYLQQFSYQEQNGEKTLLATFNSSLIKKLFIETQTPFWVQPRPAIMVWFADEQGSQRQLVGDGEKPSQQVKQDAHKYALATIFPIMDLTDSMAINVADVWGEFTQHVVSASQRYGTELSVMLKRYQDQGQWIQQWQLVSNQSPASVLAKGQLKGHDPHQLDQQMWQTILAKLASRYASVHSSISVGHVQLTIKQIPDFTTYRQVRQFLLDQPQVQQVELTQLSGQQYHFNIQLSGPWNDLQRALNMSQKYQNVINQPYIYRYQH